MDLKEIQTLIKFISNSKVDEISIERKDFKINIKRNNEAAVTTVQHMPVAAVPAQQVVIEPTQSAVPAAPAAEATPTAPSSSEENIKSPMIGTFYRKASPDKPNFVEVGDIIEKGQVICIIEAMKLFNEIEAEVSGKVVKVCVDDSEPVEYDQALFIIEPA